MKKIIPLCLVFMIFFGCSKDDDQVDNNSLFLSETIPKFSGTINDIEKNWAFGFNTYQMSSSALYINGDSSDPRRFLRFVLNQETGSNQFIISCPVYNTSSEQEFNEVFGLGVKELGESGNKFHIEIKDNDYIYNLCNPNSNYTLEILKTEEGTGLPYIEDLKVWFKIRSIKSENCTTGEPFVMKDIEIIARFIDYSNF